MTTITLQDTIQLAMDFTEKQVLRIVRGWEVDNEENQLQNYNNFLNSGDSLQMACAKTIAKKYNKIN